MKQLQQQRMDKVGGRFHHVSGIVVFVLIMLILSASSSSVEQQRGSRSDGMITEVVEHEKISQAVRRVIGSLAEVGVNRCCCEASVTTVIKVTSSTTASAAAVNNTNDDHGEAAKVDPYTDALIESLLRSANGLFKLYQHHVDDDNHRRIERQIQNNAVLIVSSIVTIREIEKFLWSSIGQWQIDSSKILAVVVQGKAMEDIKRMLDVVWSKFTMLNIVVISITSTAEHEGEHTTFTLDSFVEDECGQVHPVAWRKQQFAVPLVNFHLCPLRVAVFNAPPYMLINSGEISGIDGNILQVLAKKFNFTVNLTYVPDDIRWGEVRSDLSSSGALNLVRDAAFVVNFSCFFFRKV